jgi:GNAT superfamily N-acetyltransferase
MADENAVLGLLRSLSVHSRAMRFATAAVHLPSAARASVEQVGVIAFAPDGHCVGHAWYARTSERRAEVALVVADSYQNRALGTILLKRLAEIAACRGIDVLDAHVQSDNARMTDLLLDCGIPLRAWPDQEGLRFRLDVAREIPSAARTDNGADLVRAV